MNKASRAKIQFWLTPDIAAVSVVRHGVLHVMFADGLAGEVDVLDRMRGPVFEQARTPSGFTAVSVDPESGTVVWLRRQRVTLPGEGVVGDFCHNENRPACD